MSVAIKTPNQRIDELEAIVKKCAVHIVQLRAEVEELKKIKADRIIKYGERRGSK